MGTGRYLLVGRKAPESCAGFPILTSSSHIAARTIGETQPIPVTKLVAALFFSFLFVVPHTFCWQTTGCVESKQSLPTGTECVQVSGADIDFDTYASRNAVSFTRLLFAYRFGSSFFPKGWLTIFQPPPAQPWPIFFTLLRLLFCFTTIGTCLPLLSFFFLLHSPCNRTTRAEQNLKRRRAVDDRSDLLTTHASAARIELPSSLIDDILLVTTIRKHSLSSGTLCRRG